MEVDSIPFLVLLFVPQILVLERFRSPGPHRHSARLWKGIKASCGDVLKVSRPSQVSLAHLAPQMGAVPSPLQAC